jgi:hypothetical protein
VGLFLAYKGILDLKLSAIQIEEENRRIQNLIQISNTSEILARSVSQIEGIKKYLTENKIEAASILLFEVKRNLYNIRSDKRISGEQNFPKIFQGYASTLDADQKALDDFSQNPEKKCDVMKIGENFNKLSSYLLSLGVVIKQGSTYETPRNF